MFEEPLQLALWLGLAGIVLEFAALLLRSELIRRTLYSGMILLTSFAAAALLAVDLRLSSVLMALVALYRIFNGLRVAVARIKPTRLLHVSRRTSLMLLLAQLLTIGFWQVQVHQALSVRAGVYGLLAASCAVSLLLLYVTHRNLLRTALRPSDKYLSDDELPTVSICIPARNETDYLPPCLESV